MRGLLDTWGVRYEVVDPFTVDPDAYSTLVIGGGELIAPSGDPFYDVFRVPGRHILNAVGLRSEEGLGYLREYTYLSVRSVADRSKLERAAPGLTAAITPCPSLLLTPRASGFNARGAVGVHLHSGLAAELEDLVRKVEGFAEARPVLFIPFTHYAGDRQLMEALADGMPNASVAPELPPAELLELIGQLHCLVSASLHASLFAYSQNVPFVAFPVSDKIRYFCEDRDLQRCLVNTSDELARALPAVVERPTDFSVMLASDRGVLDEHLRNVRERVQALRWYVGDEVASRPTYESQGYVGAVRRRGFLLSMRLLGERADRKAWDLRASRHVHTVETLYAEAVSWAEALRAENSAAAEHQSEIAAWAMTLHEELDRTARERVRLEEWSAGLAAEIATQQRSQESLEAWARDLERQVGAARERELELRNAIEEANSHIAYLTSKLANAIKRNDDLRRLLLVAAAVVFFGSARQYIEQYLNFVLTRLHLRLPRA